MTAEKLESFTRNHDDEFDWFSLFKKPIGKFDLVKLELPTDENQARLLESLLHQAKANFKATRNANDFTITIHDPSVMFLKALVEFMPDLFIREIEVAIDLYTLNISKGNLMQWGLYDWLKRRLYPRQHELMKPGCNRKYYCDQTNKIKRDRTLKMKGHGSYYFNSKNDHVEVKLYVKEKDQKTKLNDVPVRIEVKLKRGGCQDFSVHRVRLLPGFIDGLRVNLSAFYTVAKGIKQDTSRVRSINKTKRLMQLKRLAEKNEWRNAGWRKYGAAFADMNDLRIVSDRRFKLAIGEALQGLRARHLCIQGTEMPEKVEESRSMYEVYPRAA